MAIIVVDSTIDRLGPVVRLAQRLGIASALAELMAIRLRFLDAEAGVNGNLVHLTHDDLAAKLLAGMPAEAASLSPYKLLAALVQNGLLLQDHESLRLAPMGTAIPAITITNGSDLALAISPDPAASLNPTEGGGGGGGGVLSLIPSAKKEDQEGSLQRDMDHSCRIENEKIPNLAEIKQPTPEELEAAKAKNEAAKKGRRKRESDLDFPTELEAVFDAFAKRYPPEARLRVTFSKLKALIHKAITKDKATPEQLIDALDAWCAQPDWKKTRLGDKRPGGYAPGPETWFSQRKWDPVEVARLKEEARTPDASESGFRRVVSATAPTEDLEGWKDA